MLEVRWILPGIMMSVVLLATTLVRSSSRRQNQDPSNAEALHLPKSTAVAGRLVPPIGLPGILSTACGAWSPKTGRRCSLASSRWS